MILAMSKDLRVIIVKLADRLHNMRTLGVMRPEKQRRIAKETLDIFAPIAGRLGINAIRIELEDLGFKAMYPMRYAVLESAVRKARGNRNEVIDQITDTIQNRLNQEKITGNVIGLVRHLFHYLRTHILKPVLEPYFFCDSVSVIRDRRSSVPLVQNNVAPAGTERYLHRVCDFIHPGHQKPARVLFKNNLFCHVASL